MEWRDEGILVAVRKHGEANVIAEIFTPGHGLHAGVIRGGAARKMAPVLQPGAQLDVAWRARLDAHIGIFTVELQRSRSAQAMADRLALAGLNAVCALLKLSLPERQPYLALYHATERLLDLLEQTALWPLAYLHWEMSLLEQLGFALDLSQCAVTGATDGLIYISPKTGRAVSEAGAGAWADRLLPLPPVMLRQGTASDDEILRALRVTRYFLERHVSEDQGSTPLPDARDRFVTTFQRSFERED